MSFFDECCYEEEGHEWPQIIKDKYEWHEVDMYNVDYLGTYLMEKMPFELLPLFLNLDWASETAKERMKKGE